MLEINTVVAIEAVLVLTAIVGVLLLPFSFPQYILRVWRAFNQLAKQHLLSVLVVGLFALVLRVGLLPLIPIPTPRIHDEFSYLLAADTFASGRLTNPTHPFWQHFESFHINQQPTYMSMYPPAQGLVLAAGSLLGHPWLGVLTSVVLMCALLCWTLQRWLPPRWALLGGLVGTLRIATFGYWGNSYWGGAVAAIGGLLVLGAFGKISRARGPTLDFLLLAIGVVIVLNSRPYEGLLLTVGAVVALILKLRWNGLRAFVRRSKWGLVLSLLVLTVGAVLTAYYFRQVTGSPLRMPYAVNQEAYAMAQPFLWQTPRTGVQYHHSEMRRFYTSYLIDALKQRSNLINFLDASLNKAFMGWLFYLGPVLTLTLLGFPKAVFDKRVRPVLFLAVVGLFGLSVETWYNAHYFAPFIGAVYVLTFQSLRHVFFYRWRGRPLGPHLAMLVPLVTIVMSVFVLCVWPFHTVQGKRLGYWCCSETGPSDRSKVIESLKSKGGTHLVIVRYGPQHDFHDEWVYNEADIDKSRVIFARDMGEEKNSKLINYFKDRKVWLLRSDENLNLTSYSATPRIRP